MKKKNKISYSAFGVNQKCDNLEDALTLFLTNPMCINITIIDETKGWYCGYMRDIYKSLKENKVYTFKCKKIYGGTMRNKIELLDKTFFDKFNEDIYEEREKFLEIKYKLSKNIDTHTIISKEDIDFYNNYLINHNSSF